MSAAATGPLPWVLLCDNLHLHETIGVGQNPSVPEPGKSRRACGFLKISWQNSSWTARRSQVVSTFAAGTGASFLQLESLSVVFGLADFCETHVHARRTGWILRRSPSIQPMWFPTRLLLGQPWPFHSSPASLGPGKLRNSSLW